MVTLVTGIGETMTSIKHVPLGIEDPYKPQPWERHPRIPKANESVVVHAVTLPQGEVAAVTVFGHVTGRGDLMIAARRADFEGEGDLWEAELPAQPAGAEVSYWFEALVSNGESIRSQEYAYSPIDSYSLRRVDLWEVRASDALIHLRDNENGLSTIGVAAVDDSIVLARIWPGRRETSPQPMEGRPWSAETTNNHLILKSQDISLRFGLTDGRVAVAWASAGQTGNLTSGEDPFICLGGASPSMPRAVKLTLALNPDEMLFGSGERFDTLDRRGKAFDVRVYEEYKQQGSRTYLPIPMLVSSRGYAVEICGTRPIDIDAGATSHDSLTMTAQIGQDSNSFLDLRLHLASDPMGALQSYLATAGLPACPPDWVFGLWMSANDWNSQERVLREVTRTEMEHIPAGVVVIEAWSDESTFYVWNDAEYETIPPNAAPRLADFKFPTTGRWPDPKGMIDDLHKGGIRVVLWQIPVFKEPDSPHPQLVADREHAIKHGLCVRNSNGTPYANPGWWFTDALVPDFTNPEATSWWLSRRQYLVDELDVDGFKTDGGEQLFGAGLRFADGRRGDEMINAFPVLYAGAYHRLLGDCGRKDGITFSRSGFAGSQKFPAHWAGDENSTWSAFRASIVAGLSAGVSGIPFWGWDIAGFSGEIPSGELYRRSWMMATFCPILQYHSEFNDNQMPSRDRTPWNIADRTGDPYVLPVCRFYTALRSRLIPYIVAEAKHVAASGRPLMCAIAFAFPGDRNARAFPYEYLFGRDILVCPTVEPDLEQQQVYLPAGEWWNMWTGERHAGPTEFPVPVPPHVIPIYVRQGAGPPIDEPIDLSAAFQSSPTQVQIVPESRPHDEGH